MTNQLDIYQGATFSCLVTVNRLSDGTAMDLTGATVRCDLRRRAGGTLIATLAVDEVDMPNGQIRIGLTDEITETLAAGKGVLDILIEYADGTKQRSPFVRVIIRARITE